MASSCRQRNDDTQRALFLLVAAYAMLDSVTPGAVNNAGRGAWVIAALASGAICGQAGLLTIWAAVGPLPLWIRWAQVLVATFGLYFAFCLGIVASSSYISLAEDFPRMAAVSLLIPLLFLCAQFPLWVRRTFGGWQIVFKDQATGRRAGSTRQFGLGHILGITAALSVSLALASPALEAMRAPGARNAGPIAPDAWLPVALMCVITCIYSAVWTISSAWACFLARGEGTGFGVMFGVWLGASLLMITIITAIAAASSSAVPGEVIATVLLHFGATAFVLMGSLHLLKLCGCVMIRAGGEEEPTTEAAAETASGDRSAAANDRLPDRSTNGDTSRAD